VEAGLVASRSEANRLIQQGAVSIAGQKVTDASKPIGKDTTIKVGKRRFIKVIITDKIT